ncbi:MAG: 1-deoxy-D-xylulose-5-phosphate reductoisomerase, partial [Pseudomonadota bacterium]
MGPKISVDSATLMNKGLEIIEAHYLFGMADDAIEVLVHPQSIIHSLVRFRDGSMLAQLGDPDMRIPISYALGWPRRMKTAAKRLDLVDVARLDFEAPDLTRFPALSICRRALRLRGGAPTILNAANEVAVAAFLAGRIGFLDICLIVENAMDSLTTPSVHSLDDVLALDKEARRWALDEVAKFAQRA